MRVLIPIDMTDAMLVSTTISELASNEAAYNIGTTYAITNTVSVTATDGHKKYESLQSSNTGNTPVERPGESAWWLDVGSTNRWNLFDLEANYKTSATDTMTYVINPGKRISTVAIGGMTCDTATITTKDGGGNIIYTSTVDVRRRDIVDWYDYFYADYYDVPIIVFDDLPFSYDGTFTLTLTGSGIINIEWLAFGSSVYLGYGPEYGANDDIVNFSTVERQDTGEITLIPKLSIPRTTQDCFTDKKYLRQIRTARNLLNAKAAIWYGIDDVTSEYYEPFLLKGIYKAFVINATYPNHATIKLELEGV